MVADGASANSAYASSTTIRESASVSARSRTISMGCTLPVGLFGEQTNTTSGWASRACSRLHVGQDEVGRERPAHDRRVCDPAEPSVELIRGFERHRGALRPSVGEQQLVQDLVRAVRGPDAGDGVVGRRRELLAEPRGHRVGVAVQRKVADDVGELVEEPGRQRVRALVRVEARGHVELGRGVGVDVAEPLARASGHRGRASSARASIALACPTRPSALAIAEVPGVNRVAAPADISRTDETVT